MPKAEDIITVGIVEDDPVIRQQLSLLINATEDLGCVALHPDAEQAEQSLLKNSPDVILLDIGLPGMSGVELLQKVKDKLPETDFIMLTVSEDDENVFQSICAGATGYLLKETPSNQIIKAIHEVREGGSPMSAGIARKVIQSFHQQQSQQTILSDRELEVLQMLCDGENYRGIAEKIFVSGNTVRAHIKNIYKKMHVHSRAEAVKEAIRKGLV